MSIIRQTLGERVYSGVKKFFNKHVNDYHGNGKIKTQIFEYDFAVHGGDVGTINLGRLDSVSGSPLLHKQWTLNVLSNMTGGGTSEYKLGTTSNDSYFSGGLGIPSNVGVSESSTGSDLALPEDEDVIMTVVNEALTAGKFQMIVVWIEN